MFGDMVGALKAWESIDVVFSFSSVVLGLSLLSGPQFSPLKNGEGGKGGSDL